MKSHPKFSRRKPIIKPQTTRVLEAIPAFKQYVTRHLSRKPEWWGKIGEDFLQTRFPSWQRTKIANQGYDFVNHFRQINGHSERIEVKTLSGWSLQKGQINLILKNGKWHNKLADTVFVVSFMGIFKADAKKLREFVNRVVARNKAEKIPLRPNKANAVSFSLESMIESGVLAPFNLNHEKFIQYVARKMRDQQSNFPELSPQRKTA